MDGPMKPKLMPSSLAPPHAQLDQPMQLVNRHTRPHQQPPPWRRANIKQHHMKLIAILGNYSTGPDPPLANPVTKRLSDQSQHPFCPGFLNDGLKV